MIYTEMVVVWWIWVFVFVFVFALFSLRSQVLVCDSDDVRGLAGFMKGLESPIDGWLFSSDCCNWVGITCDSSSGRIVRIQLPDKRLVGQLSDSISYLDQLTTLNLSHNFLSGPLPLSLFRLTHLEALDLSGNEFNHVFPVSINLPSLQVLDISDNNLTGFLPFGVCVNSTRIRVLSFAASYFTGTIPPQFGNCGFLEHVSLASNSIFGIIPDMFYSFPKLSYFSAHSSNLSGTIPPSLANSRTLSSLNLRNNSLEGSIGFNCSMMVKLTSLDLGSNNFSGTLPASLASCRKLKALNLARNKLMKGEIPESFKNLESLTYLSLSNCSFSNLTSSLKILQHCPNLTVLVLTMNFYGEQLPSENNLQFKSLKALVIANCRLTGSIPSWLNGFPQLQLLDLSFNHFTGMIPAYLGDFMSLFYLDLSKNSLSGNIPKNITHLQSMISREISLEGQSPDFPFFKNSNMNGRGSILQYNQILRFPPLLDLSNNLLSGPIWPEFGNLKNLHVLDLGHNRLTGTIPSSLSGMRNIEKLDLSYNSLTGTIPPSLVKLSFLSKFCVAYNNLKGLIPIEGQFSTFSKSGFEGNPDLCGAVFVKYCPKNKDSSQTPASEDEDGSFVLRVLVLIGFGNSFLLTVVALLVVPRIRRT